MNYFDNECNIIKWIQEDKLYKCSFPSNSGETKEVLEYICDPKKWGKWYNSSGKADPPPDFYSDEYGLMMDLMRVDDHSFINEWGKLQNPTNQKESQLQREIKESGLLEAFPNVESVIVNATTDLPTLKDHNYQYYYESFSRTVKKHIEQIPLYRKNHPNCKVVFFVFDESSGYVQVEDQLYRSGCVRQGEAFRFQLYWHFLDKRFLDVFRGSDIDYLIWYSPFKHFESNIPYNLPNVAVYDVKSYAYDQVEDYPENKIVSTEE